MADILEDIMGNTKMKVENAIKALRGGKAEGQDEIQG